MRIILLGINQNVNFMINRKQFRSKSNLENIKHKVFPEKLSITIIILERDSE